MLLHCCQAWETRKDFIALKTTYLDQNNSLHPPGCEWALSLYFCKMTGNAGRNMRLHPLNGLSLNPLHSDLPSQRDSDRICPALSYLCAISLSWAVGPQWTASVPNSAKLRCVPGPLRPMPYLSQWLHTLGSSGFRERTVCRREKTRSPATERAIPGPVRESRGGGVINQPAFPGICLALRLLA